MPESLTAWLRLPLAASADAASVDGELALVHALMLVLFVGWGGYFAWLLVRFRRGSSPRATYPGTRGRWAMAVVVLVATAELALLGAVSLPAWRARTVAVPTDPGAIEVRVVAEQFAWNVHYPGPDRRFGRTALALVSPDNPIGLDRVDPASADDVVSLNDLHVPVGRPVIVYLSSKDVVHSFTLPQMRVKQDVVPGTLSTTWFTPTRTGRWEIACSQLCGLAHYRMRGLYTVEDEGAYAAWLRAQRTDADTPPPAAR